MKLFEDWEPKLWDVAIQGEREFCYIDFEFNRSEKRFVNLVSVSLRSLGETRSIWLHQDRKAQAEFGLWINSHINHLRFVCYGAIAESRSFEALGVNPVLCEIVDLWAEAKMLQNGNESSQYGRYFDQMGTVRVSRAPSKAKALNVGRDMHPIGTSYVDSCGLYLGVNVSLVEKDQCRKLILENRPSYTQDEQDRIMRYCESDVEHLPALYEAMAMRELELLENVPGYEDEGILLQDHVYRGACSASMAMCESEGIPLDIEAAYNLASNVEDAMDSIITDLVTNYYPFFIKDKEGVWKQPQAALNKFIEDNGLAKTWPKTPSGDYASDEKTLDTYEGIPTIKALKSTRKTLKQLTWFRAEAWENLLSSIDLDENRLRVWLSPYGTQSNRNAPPAKVFIPAMSSWLRSLIRAPKGWAITGIDWASQEFMIGAALSNDPKMIAAYESGDPYLGFAKEAGAVPKDAVAAWAKDPTLAPLDDLEIYRGYEATRQLFKATVLGLQYGMGPDKLAVKLSADTGRTVSVVEATRLRDLHKKTFRVYWAWLDSIAALYTTMPLVMPDGWTMFMDNDNSLSVKNFPTQGMGAVTMRKAIILAQKRGLKILYPLHDAIYILHPEGDTKSIEMLEACMEEAVAEVIAPYKVRMEAETHTWEHVWVEKKGKKMFNLLGKYLQPRYVSLAQEAAERDKNDREAAKSITKVKKSRKKEKLT